MKTILINRYYSYYYRQYLIMRLIYAKDNCVLLDLVYNK